MKYLVTILTIFIFSGCQPKYDRETWVKNENQKSDNPRFDMVEDLRQNYLLKGTSFKKVYELLDKAEIIDTAEYEIHWTYSIGSNSGFHIDPYYLVVDFDSTGHLIATRIIEH
ncbi:MAG: hypothetical protein KF900_05550 [Bacteroidetes bacterium]|nr:hypothetical protein [Bacteroidota bacterium]